MTCCKNPKIYQRELRNHAIVDTCKNCGGKKIRSGKAEVESATDAGTKAGS